MNELTRPGRFPAGGGTTIQLEAVPPWRRASAIETRTDLPALNDPYTGPRTGDQLAAIGVLERVAGEQAAAAVTGPVPAAPPRRRLRDLPWQLPAILAVQAGLSLRLVWSNTAFGDEALYLWAGRTEWDHWIHGLNITPLGFSQYFSGAPVIYPPLAAAADAIGGLAAARCLSMLFMMGAAWLLWGTAARIYGHRAAVCSTALFVLIGTAQDLGAFATYDAMAIFCLALSFWLGVRSACAASTARAAMFLAGCALMLALADATKYAAGLWDPFIIAGITAITWQRRSARAAAAAAAVLALLLGALLVAALTAGGKPYITGLDITTLERTSGTLSIPATTVMWEGVTLIWVIAALALAAVVTGWRSGWPARLLLLALFAAVIAAPVNQARIETYVALYKHVVFGAWFGAIAAGWVLSIAAERAARHGWRIVAAVLALAAVSGYGQGTTYYHYWPDVAPMLSSLSKIVTPRSGPIAGTLEAHEISYYLGSRVSPEQVTIWPLPDQLYHHHYKFVEVDTWQPISGHWGNSGSRDEELAYQKIVERLDSIRGYRVVITQHWTDAWYNGESRVWEYVGTG